MTGMPTSPPTPPRGSGRNPALDALGDRLESAAGTVIASGGLPSDRRWSRLAIVPAIAIFALAAFALAYVVPGGDVRTAEAEVIDAAQATSDASTGRFEVTVAVDGPATEAAGGPVEVKIEGAYDIANDVYRVAVDTESLGSALGGELGSEAAGAVMDDVELIVAGDDVYLNLGPLAELLGSDVSWFKITLPELLGGEDGQAPALAPDPGAALELLNGLGPDATEVGTEQVRGVDTTHYKGTISVQEALDSVPEAERSELEEALGTLVPELVLPDIPVDVWIDEAGMVRRVTMSVSADSFGLPELVGAGSVSLTVEFFDIGEPVDVQIPPEEEVTSLDELFGGLFSEDGLGGLELPEGLEDFSMDDLEGLFEEFGAQVPDSLDDLEGMLDDWLDEEPGSGGGPDPEESPSDEAPPPSAPQNPDQPPTTA
jgi:hypothetical protein